MGCVALGCGPGGRKVAAGGLGEAWDPLAPLSPSPSRPSQSHSKYCPTSINIQNVATVSYLSPLIALVDGVVMRVCGLSNNSLVFVRVCYPAQLQRPREVVGSSALLPSLQNPCFVQGSDAL